MNNNINQHLLQKRRNKAQYLLNKKLRIKRDFKQKKDSYISQLNNQIPASEGNLRKINFYNDVFNNKPEQPSDSNNIPLTPNEKRTLRKQKQEQYLQKLQQEKQQAKETKQNRKKLIKKMKNQKTKKGQPIMKNYIDYALFKLEQDIKKEAKEK